MHNISIWDQDYQNIESLSNKNARMDLFKEIKMAHNKFESKSL